MTIYAAAAVQELHEIVKEKDAELVALRTEGAELEARLARIEEILARGEGGVR